MDGLGSGELWHCLNTGVDLVKGKPGGFWAGLALRGAEIETPVLTRPLWPSGVLRGGAPTPVRAVGAAW